MTSMIDTPASIEPQPAAPDPGQASPEGLKDAPQQQDKPKIRRGWIPAIALGFILAIVAWATLAINEHASFWSGVAGLVLSLLGAIRVGRGAWRDAAITALIACCVLLFVYGIFYVAILLALNSL